MLYAVTAKCGHTGFGTGFFMPITFAVNAETAREAAKLARDFPRVKHDHKDAIIGVHTVQMAEYVNILRTNDFDPYLKARSIQEQRRQISYDDILCRIHKEKVGSPKEESDSGYCNIIYYLGKAKIRNPRKYHLHYFSDNSPFSHVELGHH